MPATPTYRPPAFEIVGAVGDGTTDDYDAVQAAIAKAEVSGGKVLGDPSKTYYLNKASAGGLKLAPDTNGTRDWVGIHDLNLKLSANVPRAFDYDKTADYDVFQKIRFEGITVDADNIGGRHHIFAGTVQSNSVTTGLRTSFKDIEHRQITVKNGLVDSDTGTNLRRHFSYLLSHSAVNESTQTYAKNLLFEDINMEGGNAGIEVFGTNVSAVGLNVFIDNITVNRWRHDMLTVQSVNFGSAHVQLGSRAFGGRCSVTNGWGRFSGDVGLELDSMTDMYVENVVIENSYGRAFYFTNFNYPNDEGLGAPSSSNTTVEAQKFTLNDCRAVRTSTAPGTGYHFDYNLSVPLGTAILEDCSWRRTTAENAGGTGEALLLDAPMVEARTKGLSSFITGVDVDGAANSSVCEMVTVQTTGPKILRMKDTFLDFIGTNASGNTQTVRGINIGGGSLVTTIDIDGVAWNPTLTGWVGGTYAMLVGFGVNADLRGRIRKLDVTKTANFTTASRCILFGSTSNLAIAASALLYVEGCDFGLFSPGTDVEFAATSNAPRVVFRNNVPAVTTALEQSVVATTALTIPYQGEYVAVTGDTGITSIDAAPKGRRITLVFAGTPTVTDGSNLKLAGNFVSTANDTLSLISDGTNWIETSRSGDI